MKGGKRRAMKTCAIRIGDVKDSVVMLIDHGSELNLISLDFYKKGK